ncbi:MAG: CarD family transcriptional regulator [Firmicutes bacterium]|nr:CarD family transcriptional regulator [Clostridiales bacterium]MBQ4340400.1 CarD family transcriptional regulator [Bacillota bacterium]
MFEVGDKVVYPMHGAGVIEKIEKKKILDDEREYYMMKIPFGDMNVMIPVDNSENIGMRGVVSDEEVAAVMKQMGQGITEMPENWNKRYRENVAKLRSGDIFSVAEVVRNLMISEKSKGLSTGERKMLLNAKQILISEMVLVRGIAIEEAETQIEEAVFGEAVKV